MMVANGVFADVMRRVPIQETKTRCVSNDNDVVVGDGHCAGVSGTTSQ